MKLNNRGIKVFFTDIDKIKKTNARRAKRKQIVFFFLLHSLLKAIICNSTKKELKSFFSLLKKASKINKYKS